MSYLYLAIAILAEVAATSALKATEGFTRPLPSAVVVAGYVIAFYCLALTVKEIPMGISYAIWSAVGIVLVAGVGWIVYGQVLDRPALIGLGLIIASVVVVNLSQSTVH